MLIQALIKTAEDMSIDGQQHAEDAEHFLRYITADASGDQATVTGEEVYLQLAMLADAADEALLVVRIFDDEDADSATTATYLSEFQRRIYALFGDPPGCRTLRGFTQFAIEFLQTAHVIRIKGANERTLGPGPSDAVFASCLRRMKCWLALCRVVIRAEFPDFELTQSFAIFDLTKSNRVRQDGGADEDEHHTSLLKTRLRRLCKVFEVRFADALDQFNDYVRLAAQRFRSFSECSNTEAWRWALSKPMRGHRCDAILHIFTRYCAYGISTTGVEHAFARAKKELVHRSSGRNSHDTDAVDLLMLKLKQDRPSDETGRTRVIGRAREIWVAAYGMARQIGDGRRDKGLKRKRSGRLGSDQHQAVMDDTGRLGSDRHQAVMDNTGRFGSDRHQAVMDNTGRLGSDRHQAVMDDSGQASCQAEYLRCRREATRKASKTVSIPQGDGEEHLAGWTPGHEKEADFMRAKRHKRRVEEFQFHNLLESEVDAAFRRQAHRDLQAQAVKDKAAWRARERKVAARRPTPVSLREMSGKRVFVDNTLEEGRRHGMGVLLDRVHCRLVDSATENVDVVVSANIVPKQMPQTSLWCALLRGAFVVPPDMFKHFDLDRSVPATKYIAAVSFWRRVFITPKFRAEHGGLANIVTAASEGVGSKWQVVRDVGAFAIAFRRCQRQRKAGQAVVLATDDEVEQGARGMSEHLPVECKILNAKRFQASILKPDKTRG